MKKIQTREITYEEKKVSLITGYITSFVMLLALTVTFVIVDSIKNGFDLKSEYIKNIENCSGKTYVKSDAEF